MHPRPGRSIPARPFRRWDPRPADGNEDHLGRRRYRPGGFRRSLALRHSGASASMSRLVLRARGDPDRSRPMSRPVEQWQQRATCCGVGGSCRSTSFMPSGAAPPSEARISVQRRRGPLPNRRGTTFGPSPRSGRGRRHDAAAARPAARAEADRHRSSHGRVGYDRHHPGFDGPRTVRDFTSHLRDFASLARDFTSLLRETASLRRDPASRHRSSCASRFATY